MRHFLLAALAFAALASGQSSQSVPTFNKEVVRIFQNSCQTCHHPGDIAPFSLMDYKSARPWARDIQQQVLQKKMPPWKPTQGAETFQSARVLSAQDIDTLSRWADGVGDVQAPECTANLSHQFCNPSDPDLPPPMTFDGGWALGQPDLVISMPKPFAIPAAGNDIYRCFAIPTNLATDTWVSAIQINPGNRAVDHHVILYSDPQGQSKAKDDGTGYPCYGDAGIPTDPSFFGGWAPGIRPAFLAPGTAMYIKQGSYIAMQVHYHPNGTDTVDQTNVGIYFAKGPVDKTVLFLPLVNQGFKILAGDSHSKVTGSIPIFYQLVLGNVHMVAVAPHMHLLGRESHVALVSGSNSQSLIDINDWDFQWQGIYNFVTPIALPTSSTVQFTKYYDNSTGNPKNPNSPPKDIVWGEQTTDEMAVVFLGGTQDSEHRITPTFAKENVVNGASYIAGSVAPGGIVSLFGVGLGSDWGSAADTLPTTLAKSKISVGGVSAPLFYASPSQVNFQIPYEASGAAKLSFTRGDDSAVTSVDLAVAEAQPGLFTVDSSGAGPAAATLANFSGLSSSNPVPRGEFVILFATGLGRVEGGAQTGVKATAAARVINPVKVTVGDRIVVPDYAGVTPGFVGLYQVNIRVPADLASTGNVSVKITQAGVDSNSVTIAVR